MHCYNIVIMCILLCCFLQIGVWSNTCQNTPVVFSNKYKLSDFCYREILIFSVDFRAVFYNIFITQFKMIE